LFQTKEDYDGAEPSYNSVAAHNLIRLSHMLSKDGYLEMAKLIFLSFRDRLAKVPIVLPHMAAAVDSYLRPPKQVVIAGGVDSPDTKELLRVVHSKFIPNKVLLLADGGAGQTWLSEHVATLRDMTQKQGKATAYVCQDFTCSQPVNDAESLKRLLG